MMRTLNLFLAMYNNSLTIVLLNLDYDIFEKDDTEWKFVGRSVDLEKFKKLLSNNKSVLVFGKRKIGKSRFMKEACRQHVHTTCLWKDFDLDDVQSGYSQYDWFLELLVSLGADQERFKSKYPLQKIACNSCELCREPGRDRCEKQKDLIMLQVNVIISKLNKCKHKILLFIDNIDKLMDSTFKDEFLDFHKKSLKCVQLKTILSSSNKVENTAKGYITFELRPLDNTAITELLFDTTENRIVSDVQNSCNNAVGYSSESNVFKPENKPYIDAIVRLCEGLPLAASMSGLRLTEDYCLFKPADLVEILICMRLTSLSPDNCPPDDRLEIYKNPMADVKDVSSFFHCLNQQMTGTKFGIGQAVAAAEASGDSVATEAMVKMKIIKKALNRCILSIQSLPGEQQLEWHGIFRECQAALQALDKIPAGIDTAKNMVMKFMKENVEKAGLDFDKEILQDPKSLEFAIRSLSCKDKTSSQGKNDEDNEIMDSDEQQHQARKKVEATRYGTEHSSVMKVHEEVEIHKDVENSPYTDAGKANKLLTRYSVSEGDRSDFDSVSLQFANIERRQTEGSVVSDANRTSQTGSEQTTNRLHSSSPPPYTSRGCSEAEPVLYQIKNSGERNVFRPINIQSTLNSVGEPPPSYTSMAPNHHLPNNVTEPSRQYINNTSPHFISDLAAMNNIRACSLPSVNSLLYSSKIPQESTLVGNRVVYSRQRNYHNQSLHRARSDPTCYHSENNVSKQPVAKPRREIDTSVGDSLTGPPAMNYIPLSPGIVKQQSDKADAIRSPHERVHTDTRMQASNLQIAEQKEPISDMPVEIFDRSGFSTQGPQDISYNKSTFQPGLTYLVSQNRLSV
ncbi:uncharacterized protein LOC123551681 isoform X2 [Mercenaria mercenaria]|uniref:uncharacterized protein LOC123551681 isoform X2 n=1 Tax=Mercenaria mercenaria TaxID=6596 RepID=UPI00234EA5D9|nr:uncharacterized protein LOC123551681 isoform X2 [Mercenaria mercenaria]